ncbi:hypothetical protein BY458DRAFT_469635 [Sporodiniella umbellata]|nr:hypothetical protein BY458DRAFT_469635 [Sporodiniella umbellata]
MLSLNPNMNYSQNNSISSFYEPDMGLFHSMMISQEIPCWANSNYLTNGSINYPTQYYSTRQNMMAPPTLVASDTSVSRLVSPYLDRRSGSPSRSCNKRYACHICSKRFTRPSSLTTHIYSHTGEKPFKCSVDECGRQFSVVSNLRRHAKIHSNNN